MTVCLAKPFRLRAKPKGTEKLVNWFSLKWKLVMQQRILSEWEGDSLNEKPHLQAVTHKRLGSRRYIKGLLRFNPDGGPSVGS